MKNSHLIALFFVFIFTISLVGASNSVDISKAIPSTSKGVILQNKPLSSGGSSSGNISGGGSVNQIAFWSGDTSLSSDSHLYRNQGSNLWLGVQADSGQGFTIDDFAGITTNYPLTMYNNTNVLGANIAVGFGGNVSATQVYGKNLCYSNGSNCVASGASPNYTNLAYLNNSQTFTQYNNFSKTIKLNAVADGENAINITVEGKIIGGIKSRGAGDPWVTYYSSGDQTFARLFEFVGYDRDAANPIDGVYLSGDWISSGLYQWSFDVVTGGVGIRTFSSDNINGISTTYSGLNIHSGKDLIVDRNILGNENISARNVINATQITAEGNLTVLRAILPKTNNTAKIGRSDLRFNSSWVVNSFTGDLFFNNGWSFTEGGANTMILENASGSMKINITEKGIQVDSIKLNNVTAPTCDSNSRGMITFVPAILGVADSVQICAKNALDIYSWRTISLV